MFFLKLLGDKGLKKQSSSLIKYWLLLCNGQRTCLKLYSTATSYDKPSFDIERRDWL